MKDIYGKDLLVDDIVGILYHPEAYTFELRKAKVIEVREDTVYVVLDDGEKRFYKQNEDDITTRVVKVDSYCSVKDYVGPKDAIGQPIKVGDRVAFQMPVGPNICRGFEDGGHIVKITGSYVFTEQEGQDKQRRKGFNRIIKVSEG